jgi:hypothetical protein
MFNFPAAGFEYRSTQLSWLVVSGDTAFFQGTGTINGSGHYTYLVSVIDGKVNGSNIDLLRVQIWDTETGQMFYDSQWGEFRFVDPTIVISCGKIVFS